MFSALCLGIQRQVATDISWLAARAWKDSTPGDWLEFEWSPACASGRDFTGNRIHACRVSHCHYRVVLVRTCGTPSQGEGSSRELSVLRATSLHLGVDCIRYECLGSDEPGCVRDLGRVAPRAHSRLPGDDGVC